MNIYSIQNIEHCELEVVSEQIYRLRAHEGWYIHKTTDLAGGTEEMPTKLYYTIAVVFPQEDIGGIEIAYKDELPENAEICE